MRPNLVMVVLALVVLTIPAGGVIAVSVAGATVSSAAVVSTCSESADEEPVWCTPEQPDSHLVVDPTSVSAPDSAASVAVAAALTAVAGGGRYVAEGNGPVNFDCSGLTAWAWRHAGVRLEDLSYTQRSQTEDVPRSMVQPGDLVFWFGGSEHHVAIITAVNDGQITIAEAANPSAGLRTRLLGGGWDDAYLTGFGRVVRP